MAKKKEIKSGTRIQPKDADINGSVEIMMKKDADNKLKKTNTYKRRQKKSRIKSMKKSWLNSRSSSSNFRNGSKPRG